jgi:hypothetical protein
MNDTLKSISKAELLERINTNSIVLSLLYDLGLLPEQAGDDPDKWNRIASVVQHIERAIAAQKAPQPRTAEPADPGGWRPLESAPSGMPVLVQYREWNNPRNRLIEQVAWKWGGEWRVYPQTDGRAYAERWQPIPNTPQAEPAPAPAPAGCGYPYCGGTAPECKTCGNKRWFVAQPTPQPAAQQETAKPEFFSVGTIIRYSNGSTALMRVESIIHHGASHYRYYGRQFFGGTVGEYHEYCTQATDEECRLYEAQEAKDCRKPPKLDPS